MFMYMKVHTGFTPNCFTLFLIDWKGQRNYKNNEKRKWLKSKNNKKWLQV